VNETYVTLTGVVASDLRARVTDEGRPFVSFRMVSTQRRYDQARRDWVDGDTTWVGVTCWRALATNVARSIGKRDRVVVHGRLRTREWAGPDGGKRSSVDVVADAMGHDLTFGTSSFTRVGRSEVVEVPGRSEVDEVARELELDTTTDLSLLLGPEEDDELGSDEEVPQPVLAGADR
jgi:single-strand DNA-binding protein